MSEPDIAPRAWSAGRGELYECPVWDPATRSLWWVDILEGTVLNQRQFASSPTEYSVGTSVGGLGLCRNGEIVLATAEGIRILDPTSGSLRSLVDIEADRPGNRMNDAKVDPQGTFWAGSMALDGTTGAGTLYRVTGGGLVTPELESLTVSNGMDWSANGTVIYHIDSATHTVRGYNTADGGLGQCLTIDVSGFAGMPDGMTVDAEGDLWVSFWGGRAIRRFHPSGELVQTVQLPVTNPTSCAFGGDAAGVLFVTSATYGLDAETLAAEPMSGSVLALDVAARGRTAVNYFELA